MNKFSNSINRYLILVLVFNLISCTDASQESIKEMDSEKWIQDLNYLAIQLPKRHANIYHTIQPDEFEQAIANLRMKIPGLSNHQVMIEFVRLVAMIRDGHTDISMQIGQYPLRLYLFKNQLHVISATEEYSTVIGSRVVNIGNMSVEKAIEAVIPLIDRDNDVEITRKAPSFLTIPEVLHSLGIVEDMEKAIFTLKNSEGEITELSLQPVETLKDTHWIRVQDMAGNPKPLHLQRPTDFYWYTYLENSKTLYFKYNLCINQKGKSSIKKFAKEMFLFVDNTPIEQFVIDLRHNPGGNFHKSSPIVKGIKQRKSINQKGHLFVITGRNTGSAATTTSAQLKTMTEAILVGEISRANPNFTYNAERFKLPNSRLSVGYTESLHQPFPELGNIVAVDIEIENSFEDYMLGKDSVLDTILGFIAPKILKN